MMKRTSAAMLVSAVMLLGLLAGPAAAQQVGDTTDGTPAEVCALAVASSYGVQNTAVFDEQFAEFFEGGVIEGDVTDEQSLIDAVVALLSTQDQTLEDVCSIYIGVLPDLQENGENGADEDDVAGTDDLATGTGDDAPDEVVAVSDDSGTPSVVLGTTLARTGVDTMLLVLGGVLLFGLGVVALRRTRSDANVR